MAVLQSTTRNNDKIRYNDIRADLVNPLYTGNDNTKLDNRRADLKSSLFIPALETTIKFDIMR